MDNDHSMMGSALKKKEVPGQRMLGALLLLFVFFLPLHFHPTDESSQISHECSCYLGGPTQLGSAPSPPALVFAPVVSFVVTGRVRTAVNLVIGSDSARAPPFLFFNSIRRVAISSDRGVSPLSSAEGGNQVCSV